MSSSYTEIQETRGVTLDSDIWKLIEMWAESLDESVDEIIYGAIGAYNDVMSLSMKVDKEYDDLISDVVSFLREQD